MEMNPKLAKLVNKFIRGKTFIPRVGQQEIGDFNLLGKRNYNQYNNEEGKKLKVWEF
jgi:hypothetical protein